MRLRGLASGLVRLAGPGPAGAGGEAWLAAEVDRLNLEGRRTPEAAAAFLDRAVDLPGFAELCFGDYLEDSLRRTEEGWRLPDLRLQDRRLGRMYRRRFEDVLDRRDSPAVLEDFSFSEPGDLPMVWGWRDRDDDAEKPYRVRRHGRDAFVEARVSDSSILMLSLAQWNPRRFPILTWCWRADRLPEGGDERFGATNDSAAGVYVFYSLTWLGAPRHVKYVWSTTLPLDSVGRRNRIFRPWYIVAESGAENLGRWTFEAADLERDHGRTYGGDPKDRTVGLGLLTDADNTGTRAETWYGELRAWTREAWEQGRVVDHRGGLRGPPALTGSTSREVTP